MALVGLVLCNAADYLVEKQQILVFKALRFHEQEIKTYKVRYKLLLTGGLLLLLMIVGTIFLSIGLPASDFSAPEFIIYKLKEMGKISQEDIALVLREFGDLHVDQTGTLSASDIKLAQSSLEEN
ncbi:hypothetical protein AQUCO_11000031v1 [Aquilegia coerulea]|uniref:Uncharacterized protein n=1 Tax=Aquilegia coerulea TaxID=218851 RepID=A0A2G5C2X3_AQUCA|nr:hypothetical protein AQUCO_11000031v1 [Aquilegia coerulea]